MAKVPLVAPRLQFFDNNGDPLALGKIYFYEAGTPSTPKDTYTDAGGLTANANPVVLDAAGRAAIWGSGSYKVVVKSSADVTISTDDNYTAFATGASSSFADDVFSLTDNDDATKILMFQLSGLSSGTTVLSVENGNGTLAKYSSGIVDVASASTINLTAAGGDYFNITGTTGITAVTLAAGREATIKFAGALTFTNGASLILPGSVNITTVAGDTAILRGEAAGVVRVISYTRNSASIGITLGTPIATTSGTSHDFTGLPAGVKTITISWAGVSLSGTDNLLVQIGDSGGLENSGYVSNSMLLTSGANPAVVSSTAGFIATCANAAETFDGSLTLTLLDSATNTWTGFGHNKNSGTTFAVLSGVKSLSATLDRISLTRTGSNTFDAGKVNIQYQ